MAQLIPTFLYYLFKKFAGCICLFEALAGVLRCFFYELETQVVCFKNLNITYCYERKNRVKQVQDVFFISMCAYFESFQHVRNQFGRFECHGHVAIKMG